PRGASGAAMPTTRVTVLVRPPYEVTCTRTVSRVPGRASARASTVSEPPEGVTMKELPAWLDAKSREATSPTRPPSHVTVSATRSIVCVSPGGTVRLIGLRIACGSFGWIANGTATTLQLRWPARRTHTLQVSLHGASRPAV